MHGPSGPFGSYGAALKGQADIKLLPGVKTPVLNQPVRLTQPVTVAPQAATLSPWAIAGGVGVAVGVVGLVWFMFRS